MYNIIFLNCSTNMHKTSFFDEPVSILSKNMSTNILIIILHLVFGWNYYGESNQTQTAEYEVSKIQNTPLVSVNMFVRPENHGE